MAQESTKRRREVERRLLEKVGEVIAIVGEAKLSDEVIASLHSIAVLLFPIDPSLFSGSIRDRYRDQVCSVEVPSADEREDLWQAFYLGVSFPTLARVLLTDIASNWLPCFPISVQRHLYDIFFLDGLATEVVQVLVPFLQPNGGDGVDVNAVQTNVERLLVLCLLENKGVLWMARELSNSYQSKDSRNGRLRLTVSRFAQIITSIPDKARSRAAPLLSSHLFFKQIIIQLLLALDERASTFEGNSLDSTLLLTGETFSRICRRGSLDLLLSEVTPHVLNHVRRLLSIKNDLADVEAFETDSASRIWSKMMEVVIDPYTVERMSEQLLHELATEYASDIEAYWILWILFHHIFKHQASVRSMFIDKFLLWKVFPICCLRWILQFSVLECPPMTDSLAKGDETRGLLETVKRLASVWSKREFVQSVPVEQQTYVTAALGLCLEKMSREELDKTTDVMHSILQGVSYRLESPAHLTRKMASTIALVFSKVIDPNNLLYLDESCMEDTIDWKFGLETNEKQTLLISNSAEKETDGRFTSLVPVKDSSHKNDDVLGDKRKGNIKNLSKFKLVDPDEIIDLATLNCGTDSDKDDDDDDNASVDSDSSSDSSLQPYDLSDDDTDLKRKFTQLVDVIGALRKTDDADGVESAIAVTEKLVRASPDELTHMAGDLARTLIQVRCSDVTVEGEEESIEEKRQRALIALTVTCPFESLETLNNLLYSTNLDISQRIMILDVMTEAAQELANSKTMKPKHLARGPLISNISELQPWFVPKNEGPPGAGSWKETLETGPLLLNWSNRYERELPPKSGQKTRGKTRRWSLRSANKDQNQMEWSYNRFPLYAAAFMLPAMKGFDKRRHGVDLLGRDFIVLGKLIHMLSVCMKCAAMHPEASALATSLLDLLQRREVCNHQEAYVRRAVLFAASCILVSLHPSYIVTALVEGKLELSRGLEWVRTWALHAADSDTDRDCYMMAVSCLQLHAEMALQVSRALESTGNTTRKPNNIGVPSNISKGTTIKIPLRDLQY